MEVLLVRHAIAGEREEFAKTDKPDSARPLTEDGKRKMRSAARGLRALAPKVALLAASPLKRAEQTAKILAKAFPKARRVRLAELSPDADPRRLLDWLRERAGGGAVALVGHEPSLSRHAGWWLSGEPRAFFELKKGGACLLEFSGQVKEGQARLRWLAQPTHLRRAGN